MNIKKIISITLSIGVILQMLCLPAYAETKKTNNEEITLLTMLDIIDMPSDDAYLDEPVTRADFAIYIGKLVGVDEKNTSGKRFYTDLPADHWAVNTINTLTERGIICGSEGQFRPDADISYIEAISMLLAAAGYSKMAEAEGGYPNGYRNIASNYGIDTKISDYSKITFGEVCGLIYDTLFMPTPQVKELYDDGYTVDINNDVNLLARLFDIYLVKGVLTGAFGVSSNAQPACGVDEVRIDDISYDNSFEDAMDFLGLKVRAYYRSVNNTNEIFYITEDKKADYIKLDIGEFEEFNENTYELSYTIAGNDKLKTKKLEKNVTVVRNGVNVSSDIKKAFQSLNEGTIVLTSSTGSKNYDTVIIKNYENMVVSSFNKEEKNIFDKIIRGNCVSLEGVNYLRIFDREGNKKSLDDIAQNMTLSVCKSDEFCEMIISEETVSGKINSVHSDSSKIYISIDGSEYEVSRNYYEANQELFGNGKKVKLYINAFGTGIWLEVFSSDGYLCGYIIKTFTDDENETFGIKVLTQAGTIEKLLFAQKSRVNKQPCRKPEEVAENLESRTGQSANQVAVYKQNENGEITVLETAVPYGSNMLDANLWVDNPLSSGYFYSSAKMMGESVLVEDSAICFKVPERITTSTKDEDFSVIKLSALSDKTTYNAESYRTGMDKLSADILLIKSNSTSGSWFHNMVVVDDVYEYYNEEKDEIEKVADMWVGGNKITYRAARNVSFDEMPQFFLDTKIKIKKGDVLRIFRNSEGEITNADRFYSAETGEPNQAMNAYNAWSWEIYFAYGYITDIKDNIARFEYTKNGETKTGLARIGSAPILVGGASGKRIIAGTVSDLDEAMNERSLVFFGQNFGNTQQIYIIK